jgi:hypothetical protein
LQPWEAGLPRQSRSLFPIGLEAEIGRVAVWCDRPGFPSQRESVLLRTATNNIAIALQRSALLLRHERAERILGIRATRRSHGTEVKNPAKLYRLTHNRETVCVTGLG